MIFIKISKKSIIVQEGIGPYRVKFDSKIIIRTCMIIRYLRVYTLLKPFGAYKP